MASASLRPYSAKKRFLFRVCRGLRTATDTLSPIEETDKIMNAQKARGAQLDTGKMTDRVKALVPVLIPLFISAFRRADELAMAMECRCYRGGTGRTRLKVLRCEKQDYIDLAVCIACFAVILASRLVFPNY